MPNGVIVAPALVEEGKNDKPSENGADAQKIKGGIAKNALGKVEEKKSKEKADKNAKDKKEVKAGIAKVGIDIAKGLGKPKIINISKLNKTDFENLKTSLFVKVMTHDLVLKNEYDDTLEERIARLLTNDMGETIRTEVSYALIQEFKKFMYLVACEILQKKRDKSFSDEEYDVDPGTNQKYFKSPFHPPYILDLVWRFIIQEGEIYSELCTLLVGGYIDRHNPLRGLKYTLEKYEAGRIAIIKNEALLKPYSALWPKIINTDQLALDYEYDKLLHNNEKLSELIQLRDEIHEIHLDDLDIGSIKAEIDHWREKKVITMNEDFEEYELVEEPDLLEFGIEDKEDIDELYERLIEYEFYKTFEKSI